MYVEEIVVVILHNEYNSFLNKKHECVVVQNFYRIVMPN